MSIAGDWISNGMDKTTRPSWNQAHLEGGHIEAEVSALRGQPSLIIGGRNGIIYLDSADMALSLARWIIATFSAI